MDKVHVDQADLQDRFSRATTDLISGGNALMEKVKSVSADLMPNETAEDPCEGTPWLNMKDVVRNNLGNQGPDKDKGEGLYFKGLHQNSKTEKEVLLRFNADPLFTYQPNS